MEKIFLNRRTIFILAHDICAAIFAWYIAFLLRFNFEIPLEHIKIMRQTILIAVSVQTISFLVFSLHRGTWRFVSLLDLKRILSAIFISGGILSFIFITYRNNIHVPRSVLIINPIILIFVMGGSRFIYRFLKEYQFFGSYLAKGKPVIIFGVGKTTFSLLKSLTQSQEWRVVTLLDSNKAMHGREILGIKVQGDIANLAKVAKFYKARHIIVTASKIDHKERQKLLEVANEIGLQVLTIPLIDDLMSGRVSISQIRRIDVEDLLGRDPVNIDISGLKKLIYNKTILVSGAGGSIGSELCRQIIKFKPNQIICLDMSEYALYKLEQELSSQKFLIKFIYLIGDIKNSSRLNSVLTKYQPQLVFHAAAYKHVPLMEVGNVLEAFNNNVLGTYFLAMASKKAKVKKFILISTDKAVNPVNVMGATKRLAEMICQGLQDNNSTEFVVVRFGNVLGSSGSVIPKFRKQINAGGPITVTHPDITRYFMSIREAAQLVLQASLLGKGREIFVLNMGQPVRIIDLAKDMIKLSGLSKDTIKIVFSGLRPGEKLYEELLLKEEKTLPTTHKKIYIAYSKSVNKSWITDLLKWIKTIQEKDEVLIKKELKFWLKGIKKINK